MPFSEFPIATRVAQPDAFHPTYASPGALKASTEAARGAGATWRVRGPGHEHLYEELAGNAAKYHIQTAGGRRLNVLSAAANIYHVDAFGAAADGVTDDTNAIKAALDAVPEGGVLVFSAGKTYIVSAKISSRGRSMTILAYGATIKCAADSVWHVFDLGGTTSSSYVNHIRWYGGIFDGNFANQKYYPNQNGTTIYTDQGAEPVGSYTGTPFYENSPINGATWDNAYVTAANGGGNDGLITVKFADLCVVQDIECRNYVRNGVATWGAREVHVTRCRSVGQLPTTYFELSALFGLNHEGTFIKVSGSSENAIINGSYEESVFVSECYHIGGAMPLFVRTNPPKPPAPGIIVNVNDCHFLGIARECWFETPQAVHMTGCTITCADYPNTALRNNSALFIGSGCQDWYVEKSYIYGRIDTNVAQAVRRAALVNSTLISSRGSITRIVQCHEILGCRIESQTGGVLADIIRDSEIYLEDTPGTESFKVQQEMTNCIVGREWFESTRETLSITAGKGSATLSGTPGVVQRIRVRSPAYMEGHWFELHKSDYKIAGTMLAFSNGETAFGRDVEVEVDWYAIRTDTLTTTVALETTYILTQTGGNRTQDILSITYNGVAVPHAYKVADPSTQFHWTHAMNASGFMVITLVNGASTIANGLNLVVTYRPPLRPYRQLVLGNGDTVVDITGVNFRGIMTDGGRNYVRGVYSDIAAPAFFCFKDGTELVDIDGAKITRLTGGLLCGVNDKMQCQEATVANSHVRDWMMQGARLLARGETASKDQAVGCLRANGTQFLRRFHFINNIMEYSGKESGAGRNLGRNQSGMLTNGYASVGGNLYLGGVTAASVGVGSRSIRYTKADLS